jgi:hypothetical protein
MKRVFLVFVGVFLTVPTVAFSIMLLAPRYRLAAVIGLVLTAVVWLCWWFLGMRRHRLDELRTTKPAYVWLRPIRGGDGMAHVPGKVEESLWTSDVGDVAEQEARRQHDESARSSSGRIGTLSVQAGAAFARSLH